MSSIWLVIKTYMTCTFQYKSRGV